MKSHLTFIGLFILFLVSGVYFYLLYSRFHLDGAKIAVLQQQLAELSLVRAQNRALQHKSRQFEELEDLRRDNDELFRIRNEVRQLQAAAEKRRLGSASTLSGLPAEHLRLRDEHQMLELAPETVSARLPVESKGLTYV